MIDIEQKDIMLYGLFILFLTVSAMYVLETQTTTQICESYCNVTGMEFASYGKGDCRCVQPPFLSKNVDSFKNLSEVLLIS